MAKVAVVIIGMKCTVCKHINYTRYKNTRNIQGKIELKKYCRYCKKHILHKETKI